MLSSGKITKINTDLNYGFIKVKNVGEVFFSLQSNITKESFASLNVNDTVKLSVTNTDRGLFATSLNKK